MIASIYGYSLVEIETNSIKSISTDLKVRQAYDYVDLHMGGSMAMDVMLDTGKKDGIKDIKFLSQMETLQNHIDKHPLTWKTSTVHFGLLAAFAFFWALLADFFLAPAMMLLFKPLGEEKGQMVE